MDDYTKLKIIEEMTNPELVSISAKYNVDLSVAKCIAISGFTRGLTPVDKEEYRNSIIANRKAVKRMKNDINTSIHSFDIRRKAHESIDRYLNIPTKTYLDIFGGY